MDVLSAYSLRVLGRRIKKPDDKLVTEEHIKRIATDGKGTNKEISYTLNKSFRILQGSRRKICSHAHQK